MRHHGRPNTKAHDGCLKKYRNHAQTQIQVLSHNTAGLAAQPYCKRQVYKIVCHQRHIGRLECDIRSCRTIAMPTAHWPLRARH